MPDSLMIIYGTSWAIKSEQLSETRPLENSNNERYPQHQDSDLSSQASQNKINLIAFELNICDIETKNVKLADVYFFRILFGSNKKSLYE